MTEPNNLFKPIGEIAQDTEARPEVDDDDVRLQEGGDFQQGNEQEVEQTESLCMECHEQASRCEFQCLAFLPPRRRSSRL